MGLDKGREVYKTAGGEKVFETTPRPADIDFQVWLQNQREGKIAFAMSKHDFDEVRRIGSLSDDDLAKELGVYKFPGQEDSKSVSVQGGT